MNTDSKIQKDVMEEIKWQPFLNSSEIGVAVKDGIVTLSGRVDSYSKKLSAEEAAKKVHGVRAIAEDIQIGVSPGFHRSDTEIAEAVLNALKWHSAVPSDHVKVKVDSGVVTLEGMVEWGYQRSSAEHAVKDLTGVRYVANLINIKPKVSAIELEQKISSAFMRSASIDAHKIKVNVDDNRVTLTGRVRSLAESEDAEDAAWAAPGVLSVANKLEVEESELVFTATGANE